MANMVIFIAKLAIFEHSSDSDNVKNEGGVSIFGVQKREYE